MINSIKEFAKDFFHWLNPADNKFNNVSHILGYGVKVVIVVLIIAVVIGIIKNRRKIFNFLTSVVEELRKTDWLNRKSLTQLSLVTIIIITMVTLIILGMDQGFISIRKLII